MKKNCSVNSQLLFSENEFNSNQKIAARKGSFRGSGSVQQANMPPPLNQKNNIDYVQNRHVNIVSFLVAACLFLRFYSAIMFWPEFIQEIAFLTLIFPVLVFSFYKLGDAKLFLNTLLITTIYLIPLTLSFVYLLIKGNADYLFGAVTLFNVVFMFFLASLFASSHSCDLWLKIMRHLSLLSCPLFLYVILTQQHAYVWGRWEPLGGLLHPNWWGMMGLGLAWCSFAWKNTLLRYFFMGVGLYFMYFTQSRGSMVAFFPAFVFCGDYFSPFTRKKAVILLIATLLGIIAFLGISYATSYDLLGKLFDFFANDVMKLNDPNRGIGSGMTGRVAAYSVAWKAFLDSPFFGAGYSQFAFVHNGFLIILAESGLFSLVGVVVLFALSIAGYIKMHHWQGLGFILSYLVLLLTFPRTFNINMVSLILMMILMRGIALILRKKPVHNV